MKVLITGNTTITNMLPLLKAIKLSGYTISEVVCGGSAGVEKLGKRWAEKRNIPVRFFFADWHKHGSKGKAIKNKQMVRYADGVIAVHDGKDKDTRYILDLADELGKARTILLER